MASSPFSLKINIEDEYNPRVPAWVYSPDTRRWVSAPCDEHSVVPIGKTDFRMVSWNIWFGEVAVMSRHSAQCAAIRAEEPDFFALQEVTPPILNAFLNEPWIRESYYVSDARGSTFREYGVVLFSRHAFSSLHVHELPSRLDRKLVVGTFALEGGRVLCVATSHLESYAEDARVRQRQLEEATRIMRQWPFALFAGDTNFQSPCEDDEPAALGLVDMWPALRPTEEGLTQTESTAAMAGGTPKCFRLDRAFFCEGVLPLSIEHLGSESIVPTEDEGFQLRSSRDTLAADVPVFPSDHLGLVFSFRCCVDAVSAATAAAIFRPGAKLKLRSGSDSIVGYDLDPRASPELFVTSTDSLLLPGAVAPGRSSFALPLRTPAPESGSMFE